MAFASPTADIQLIVPTPQGGGFLVEALHNSVRFLTPPYGILLAKDGEPQNIVKYSMMCSNKMDINDSDLKDIMEELLQWLYLEQILFDLKDNCLKIKSMISEAVNPLKEEIVSMRQEVEVVKGSSVTQDGVQEMIDNAMTKTKEEVQKTAT